MFKKNLRLWILYILMVGTFIVIYHFGISTNPNFNIHDFCLDLAAEITGMLVALLLIDSYIKEKEKRNKKDK